MAKALEKDPQRQAALAARLHAHCQLHQVKKLTEYHPPPGDGKPAFVVEYQNQGHYPGLKAYFALEDLLVELHGQEVELMNPHDLAANPDLKRLLGTAKTVLYA